MFLSQAIGRIKPSPTFVISARAKALVVQGIDIIDLSVGEPDIAPPAQVL
jgi:aspartate aminotransferase